MIVNSKRYSLDTGKTIKRVNRVYRGGWWIFCGQLSRDKCWKYWSEGNILSCHLTNRRIWPWTLQGTEAIPVPVWTFTGYTVWSLCFGTCFRWAPPLYEPLCVHPCVSNTFSCSSPPVCLSLPLLMPFVRISAVNCNHHQKPPRPPIITTTTHHHPPQLPPTRNSISIRKAL